MADTQEKINLNIKQSDGKKLVVSVCLTDTILKLKEEVTAQSEIPVERQRLIFSGKVLKDEETVDFYNLKNDLTVHLVRSNPAPKAAPAQAAPVAQQTTPAATQSVSPGGGAASLPNPFAALGGGGGAGGMGANPLAGMDSNGLQSALMNDPNYMNMISGLMSNPEVVRGLIQSNPQLQSMGMSAEQISGMMSMLNNPQVREMMSNPQMREMMAGMGGMGGMGGGANPFAALAGGATPDGTTPAAGGLPPNFAAMMSQLGAAGGAGGLPQVQQQQPAANLAPPEERFQVQLSQLNDMGFFDAQQNIRALLACGGNVHAAVEYLFAQPQ